MAQWLNLNSSVGPADKNSLLAVAIQGDCVQPGSAQLALIFLTSGGKSRAVLPTVMWSGRLHSHGVPLPLPLFSFAPSFLCIACSN